jgi:hypothetical protein
MRFLSPAPSWSPDPEVLFPADPLAAEAPGQLPLGDTLQLGVVELGPGRLVLPRNADEGRPSSTLWLTDDVVPGALACWAALAEQFPTTGLWPLLIQGIDEAHLLTMTEAAVDAIDVHELLETGWHDGLVPINNPWAPGSGPLAPFGPVFPGLAPAQRATNPEPLVFPDGQARIGLVSCRRAADAVARAGWTGAINVRSSAEVSAVLRSWEDRFGAILVGLAFATMTLVVTRPPTSDDDALRVAAEVAALCPDALWQPESSWPHDQREATLEALSRQFVRQHVWHLWFD